MSDPASAERLAATATVDDPLLDVRDLRTYFFTKRGVGKAVDGVTFQLRAGETLGLVGESGSGKSITAVSLLRLNPPRASKIVGGQVWFKGEDLLAKSPQQLRSYCGSKIAYVPQDPLSSLNPVFTIGAQIAEPLQLHLGMRGEAVVKRSIELLKRVYVPLAKERVRAYPHHLSGGMRQRVVSAIAISCDPDVLIADEPTTSLDVTVQADYLDLLREIQRERRFGIVFITHDFGIVANICDRVAVMYAGRIVEQAPTTTLFSRPAHPYTKALLDSLPEVGKVVKRLPAIEGQPPSLFQEFPGCPFAPRCPVAMEHCTKEYPPFVELGSGQGAACWKLV